MAKFTDQKGRVWVPTITVGTCRTIKNMLGINLYGLISDGGRPLGELLADPMQLVDVIFVCCQKQATEMGVTDEEFGQSLGGQSLGDATDAFLEELTAFFPNHQQRKTLEKLLETSRKVSNLAMEKASKMLDEITPEGIVAQLSGQFGGPPASSASTQAHFDSGN